MPEFQYTRPDIKAFLEYETAGSLLAPYCSWNWARNLMAKVIARRVNRKHRRYRQYMGTQQDPVSVKTTKVMRAPVIFNHTNDQLSPEVEAAIVNSIREFSQRHAEEILAGQGNNVPNMSFSRGWVGGSQTLVDEAGDNRSKSGLSLDRQSVEALLKKTCQGDDLSRREELPANDISPAGSDNRADR